MKVKSSQTPAQAARGLDLLRAAWQAGFDTAICGTCLHFGYCAGMQIHHEDIKFDPACEAYILDEPLAVARV